MKSYFIFLALVIMGLCCVSQTYGQDGIAQKTTIDLTFINSTNTNAFIIVSEQITKNPHTYIKLQEISMSPGESETFPLLLSEKNNPERTLSIFTSGGEGFGQTCGNINIDISESSTFLIKLKKKWIYPGEEFWPAVEPFQVIKAKLIH